MKRLFVVANWKSNKTVGETEEWMGVIKNSGLRIANNLEVVICPPFTLLYPLRELITTSQIILGAQDVSPFPEGAFTGEVSARQLVDLGAKYAIIGHSERRNYFHEDEQMLANKVKEATEAGLMPIYCVQNKGTLLPDKVKIILYEPISAIGTGQADNPISANEVARTFKEKYGQDLVALYGGSVTPENVAEFCRQEDISGVGVGSASLDSNKFVEILKNASQI